jgi:hypothetical protein
MKKLRHFMEYGQFTRSGREIWIKVHQQFVTEYQIVGGPESWIYPEEIVRDSIHNNIRLTLVL